MFNTPCYTCHAAMLLLQHTYTNKAQAQCAQNTQLRCKCASAASKLHEDARTLNTKMSCADQSTAAWQANSAHILNAASA